MSKFTIDKIKNYGDQFDISRFMLYNVKAESYDVFNSKFLDLIKNLPVSGEYVIQSEILAPDAVAYQLYSNSDLFWVLMLYNDLSCYQKLRPGTRLKFPSYQSIERAFFSLG